jgi:hypothetical protein
MSHEERGAPDAPRVPGARSRSELQLAIGALALGALDPHEARQVRAHLADCPECAAEYQAFLGVRGVMDAALASGADRAERYRALAVQRRRRTSRQARMPRGRRRIATAMSGMAAALVIAAAGVTGAVIGAHHGGPAVVQPAPSPSKRLPPVTDASGVTAAISYQDLGWGTWVEVTMSHVPAGYTCRLVAYGTNGTAFTVSTWRSVQGQASVTVPGAVALAPGEIHHFEVQVGSQAWNIKIPMAS